MDTVEDINKLFEQYLEKDEVIEYISQKDVFPKDNVVVFVILAIFSCCIVGIMIFANATFTELLFPIVFLVFFLFFAYISMKNPYLFFTPRYYCITNRRIMSYSPKFDIFNQCSLDMVYHANKTGLHDVTFTNKHHFIVFEFKDIPDATELSEIMKGKLQR